MSVVGVAAIHYQQATLTDNWPYLVKASEDQPCVGKPVERAAGDLLPTDAACCGGVGRLPVQPWWGMPGLGAAHYPSSIFLSPG